MSNNKARLFQLYRYLYENTDDRHYVSTQQILQDVRGDRETYSRNTVPSDIKELQDEGYNIVRVESSGNLYYLGSREFEPQELRLLIDAVAASRFITADQSATLITRLQRFASKYQLGALTNNLYTSAVKSTNTAALYAIEVINDAISRHQQLWFQYVDYSPYRRKVLRRGGRRYTISPYGLVWDNDHYYLVGWSDDHSCVVQFRVDRMKNVQIFDEPARDPGEFSMETYVKENFQMYSGTPTDVTLLCRGDMMNAVVDRFGEKANTHVVDPQTLTLIPASQAKYDRPQDLYFTADVTVGDTPTFYAWVFQFGGAIRILGPENVVQRYQEMLRGQMDQ